MPPRWQSPLEPPDASFYDLIGAGEERLRHGEAERLRSLQVDHQLELGRLLDRQILRLRALQQLGNLTGGERIKIGDRNPIACKAVSFDNALAELADHRDLRFDAQLADLLSHAIQHCRCNDVNSLGARLPQGLKGGRESIRSLDICCG